MNDIRFRVAAARRILYRHGCDSQVGGHVSARAEGEDAFWVTPFEFFDETTPDGVAKVDFDLQVLEGSMVASPAIQFHAAIYRERPDVQSVIHTHSFWASVLSGTQRPLGMYNAVSVLFADEQSFHEDDGTRPSVEGKLVATALGDKHLLWLKNHGVIVVGPSLEHATVDAVSVELTAHYQVEMERIGATEMAPAEVTQSKVLYEQYFRQNMWPALLRRLRHSDPDLFAYLDEPGAGGAASSGVAGRSATAGGD
ncbi:MAG TPA: class II aldolase/adducin family protein [Acidimicrobiales bacterium]|jgi:L-fuculose-phosphate aldolase|nr:class II aldolase/adducin family protein [Acidimicrobiales bacterium]